MQEQAIQGGYAVVMNLAKGVKFSANIAMNGLGLLFGAGTALKHGIFNETVEQGKVIKHGEMSFERLKKQTPNGTLANYNIKGDASLSRLKKICNEWKVDFSITVDRSGDKNDVYTLWFDTKDAAILQKCFEEWAYREQALSQFGEFKDYMHSFDNDQTQSEPDRDGGEDVAKDSKLHEFGNQPVQPVHRDEGFAKTDSDVKSKSDRDDAGRENRNPGEKSVRENPWEKQDKEKNEGKKNEKVRELQKVKKRNRNVDVSR